MKRVVRKRKVREASIEDGVVRWAKEQGIKSRKMNGLGNASWPDRMFILPNGIVAFIEFKRPGGEPTALQKDTIEELKRLHQNVIWTDDPVRAKVWLTTLMEMER